VSRLPTRSVVDLPIERKAVPSRQWPQTRRVVDLEKSMPTWRTAAARAVEDEGTPPPDLRRIARLWLRGQLDPGYERMPAEQPITYRDGAANTWLGAQNSAANAAAPVHEQIGLGPLYDRVDAVEVEAWGQFVARLRELAGER
jgi:hypothetical protein